MLVKLYIIFLQEATEVKIAAREKRKAEEAAQEEERKAQEEEAKKNKEGAEEEMKEEVKEDVAEDKDEFKKDINTEDEFEENYDDPLPLEDVDNDGGLAKDDDYGLLDDDEANVTVSDADVNEEMDVNSNSAFLSGDGAEGEADKEHFESMEGNLQILSVMISLHKLMSSLNILVPRKF